MVYYHCDKEGIAIGYKHFSRRELCSQDDFQFQDVPFQPIGRLTP